MVFKPNPFKSIFRLVIAFVVSAFVYFVASYFIPNPYPLIVAVVIILFGVYNLVTDFKTQFVVENDVFICREKSKIREYAFSEFYFIARSDSNGSQTVYALRHGVTDFFDYTGVIDCDGLTSNDYEKLLECLHIIGDNAPVHKLN